MLRAVATAWSGNQAYADSFEGPDAKVKMLRVVNIPDVVPRVRYPFEMGFLTHSECQ